MVKSEVKDWNDLPLMLTTKEVARLTGNGEQAIRNLCHSKEIPFKKIGRSFMFSRDALKEWLVANS